MAGFFYFATIIFGMFAQLATRSGLKIRGDAAATASNILSNDFLYRTGMVSDLLMLVCYVIVTIIFYEMFKCVSRGVSALAAAFSIVGTSILALGSLFHLLPLLVLDDAAYLASFSMAQRESLALFSLTLHAQAYGICLVFFGFYMILIGWLTYRSGFIAKIAGVLMAVGGLTHLVINLADILIPAVAYTIPVAFRYPPLIGEIALTICLILFGVGKKVADQRAQAVLSANAEA